MTPLPTQACRVRILSERRKSQLQPEDTVPVPSVLQPVASTSVCFAGEGGNRGESDKQLLGAADNSESLPSSLNSTLARGLVCEFCGRGGFAGAFSRRMHQIKNPVHAHPLPGQPHA